MNRRVKRVGLLLVVLSSMLIPGGCGSSAPSTTTAAVTLVSIAVTPNPVVVLVGSNVNYVAEGKYSDGSTQNLTTTASWTSGNTGFATIVATTGVATGVAVSGGAFQISATYLGIEGTANLTVTANVIPIAPAGSMTIPRYLHTAILLGSGEVLVAGGQNLTGYIFTAELYNPTAEGFTATGSMITPRELHTATLLNTGSYTGNVLIAGGNNGSPTPTADGELYNPVAGTFTETGSLNTARFSHTATLLLNGKVLIAGGNSSGGSSGILSSAELYDPVAGTFTATTGAMATARYNHTATLLTTGPNSGSVLITGGFGASGAALSSAELYNPAAGTFTATGSMTVARYDQTATLLTTGSNSGKVLITGGFGSSGSALSSTELYDPVAGTFTATGNMTAARYGHTATLLASGKVLIAGGVGTTGTLASAELYDPVAGSFSTTGNMTSIRYGHTATLLTTGMVLITGGTGTFGSNDYLATAELYNPLTGTFGVI